MKEGIDYYPVESDHVYNKKVRLLINEFDSDGYWIWSCLLSKIYKEKGYYMDLCNVDELELFAIDVCKKKVSLVKEVIGGCVRRGLFDQTVFDVFELLTSDRIQLNYLHATNERRKKGTCITLISEILLIEEDKEWKNVSITGISEVFPGKIPKNTGKIPQRKVKNSKGEDSKGEGASATKSYKDFTGEDFIEELKKFHGQYPKDMLNAFFKYWKEKNSKGKMRFQLQKTWETGLRLESWERRQNANNYGNGKANGQNHAHKPVITGTATGAGQL